VAGHWGGDNAANWAGLFESVGSVLAPNMWGIAMSGADICGFNDEGEFAPDGQPRTTKLSDAEYRQLCNRCGHVGGLGTLGARALRWLLRSSTGYGVLNVQEYYMHRTWSSGH
jgi:hypothetical protein